MVGVADGGAARQVQTVAEVEVAGEAEAGVVAEVVVVQPDADAVLQGLVVGTDSGSERTHEVAGGGVEHMGLEADGRGATEDFKEHAVAGVDQAAALAERARVAAVVQNVEHLTIGGAIAVQQLDLDLAVECGQSGDVDLVVVAGAGARGTGRARAADFKQGDGAGVEGEGVVVLVTGRITGAEQAVHREVAGPGTAALERGVRRHPQGADTVERAREFGQIGGAAGEQVAAALCCGLHLGHGQRTGGQRQGPLLRGQWAGTGVGGVEQQ